VTANTNALLTRVQFQAGASHPRHPKNDPAANPNFHQTEIDLFIMTRNRNTKLQNLVPALFLDVISMDFDAKDQLLIRYLNL
jgi:hypothetical protein